MDDTVRSARCRGMHRRGGGGRLACSPRRSWCRRWRCRWSAPFSERAGPVAPSGPSWCGWSASSGRCSPPSSCRSSTVRTRLWSGADRGRGRGASLPAAGDRGGRPSNAAVRTLDVAGGLDGRWSHDRACAPCTRGRHAAGARLGSRGRTRVPGGDPAAPAGGPVRPRGAGRPARWVDRVGAGLEIASDDPVRSMLEAVAVSAGSSYAAVRDEQGRLVSSVGEPAQGTSRHPTAHGGESPAR